MDKPKGLLVGLALPTKKPEGSSEPESDDTEMTAVKALRTALESGADEELLDALKGIGCFRE